VGRFACIDVITLLSV